MPWVRRPDPGGALRALGGALAYERMASGQARFRIVLDMTA